MDCLGRKERRRMRVEVHTSLLIQLQQ